MAQTTLYEVADRAGVSLATASRVLNGSTRQVGEPLRSRVLKAATELNYSANGPAQAMARGHSNTVGLIVGDIADPYFTQIAAGVVEAAEAHNLTVTMGTTDRQLDREARHLAGFRSQRARGVIIVGSRAAEGIDPDLVAQVASYQQTGGRLVMISQPVPGLPTIELDNRKLAAELARALVDVGHERFALLAGPRDLLTAVDRAEGFRNGLRSRKVSIPTPAVRYGAFTRAGGHQAMTALLAADRDPGCVFCVNDVMALGAMAAIREAGLRPGVDVPIAGFDDIPTLADVQPPLTTVSVPLRDSGRQAVDLLLGEGSQTRHITGTVLLRESTARS